MGFQPITASVAQWPEQLPCNKPLRTKLLEKVLESKQAFRNKPLGKP